MPTDAEIVTEVLDRFQASLRDRVAGGIGRLQDRPESWSFVGSPVGEVLELLRVARSATPAMSPRFLECGSGFGVVAALAQGFGFKVTGIEVVPEYIELSRQFFQSVRVEQADLLTFDRYGEFDVVYYFAPFADEAVQADFEHRIERSLRPGGIILAKRKASQEWRAGGAFDLLWTDGTWLWALQKRAPPAA